MMFLLFIGVYYLRDGGSTVAHSRWNDAGRGVGGGDGAQLRSSVGPGRRFDDHADGAGLSCTI